MGDPPSDPERRRGLRPAMLGRILLPVAVVAFSSVLTTLASRQASVGYSEALQASREAAAHGMVHDLRLRITAYEVMLRSLSAFISNRPDLTEALFHRFIVDQHLVADYPGVRAIGYCDWTAESVARARVKFVEPEDKPNLSVVGFDMFSERSRRAAIERAISTRSAAACEPIVLLQDRPQPTPGLGFLVFMPVYDALDPTRVQGVAFVAFRGQELFDSTFSLLPALSYEVRDGARILGRWGNPRGGGMGPIVTLSAAVAGRTWHLDAGGGARTGDPDDPAPRILLVGYLASLMLGGLVWTVLLRRDVALIARQESEAQNAILEQRVAERTGELQAANQELEAFCYTVSHDLRAPLRSMAGFGRILEEDYAERLDDEGRDYLARIQAAAVRLSHLIDGLLAYSRLSRSTLHRAPVNLSGIAERIIGEWEAQEPSNVRWEVQPDMSALADPALVEVLLQNLLANAQKFSEGSAQPVVRFGSEIGASGLEFSVADNGVGFNPAHADRLFRPFERLHTEKEFAGTGIGLASVERIVRRHGGSIRAESELDGGAKFTFTLG